MIEQRGMNAAAWTGLLLAVASWPLALVSIGVLMGESVGNSAEMARHLALQRFWSPILAALVLLSFCGSLWLSGLSFRHARMVSGITLAIDSAAIVMIVGSLIPS